MAASTNSAALRPLWAWLGSKARQGPATAAAPASTNLFRVTVGTNSFWVSPGANSRTVKAPAQAFPLKPGVYETKPYSCIVVVPGPHPDDIALVPPPAGAEAMPTVKPDLQFIPRPVK